MDIFTNLFAYLKEADLNLQSSLGESYGWFKWICFFAVALIAFYGICILVVPDKKKKSSRRKKTSSQSKTAKSQKKPSSSKRTPSTPTKKPTTPKTTPPIKTADENKARGIAGENALFEALNQIPYQKWIYRNVYFRTPRGNLSEIDMVMVTNKAIFVFENKNYTGAVYGSETGATWTSFCGGQKYSLYSPIKQNESHIKAFWNSAGAVLTNEKKDAIYSIIVFNDSCTLNVSATKVPVLQTAQVADYIKSFLKGRNRLFQKKELEYICNLLEMNSNLSDDIKKQHIEYVQTVQKKSAG